jgi:hypothetical protein
MSYLPLYVRNSGLGSCTVAVYPHVVTLHSLQGRHRISVTKCGHIFGHYCIQQALQYKEECPTCRNRLNKKQIVLIYNSAVVAVENTNLDIMYEQLVEERSRREKVS